MTLQASTPAENKETLRKAYALWHETRGGSVDHWLSICDERIRFGSLAQGRPRVEFTAALSGRDTLKAYFGGLLGAWSMIHFTVGEMVAEGDRVLIICSTAWRNKANGKVFETPKIDSWRFAGGKAIEFYEYYDTAGLVAAAAP